LEVLLLYNEPALSADDPDWAAEAGVLDAVGTVSDALVARGHSVRRLGVGSSVSEFLETFSRISPPDVVFNLFEGLGGIGRGEAEISGLVELLGFPMTGSPAECLALVRDKARTKWLLAGAGLPTPEFMLISEDDAVDEEKLRELVAGGAVIVKPAHEDASLGITPESVVTRWEPLERRVEFVRERYGPVLIERFIVGREFNAAVIALPEPELLPLAEIEFSGRGAKKGWQIVSYDAKWLPGSADDRATPARCPAKVDPATEERIRQVSIAAFRITGCRDYGRVDLRMDTQGHLFVLEVNGNPDIGPTAGFAPALGAAGISFEQFVDQVVQNTFARRASGQRSCDRAQLK
jgi:D-alanine-D-alanine ligase